MVLAPWIHPSFTLSSVSDLCRGEVPVVEDACGNEGVVILVALRTVVEA